MGFNTPGFSPNPSPDDWAELEARRIERTQRAHNAHQLGRWRRLSRCYEGTEASARAWLEVASVGYLAWRASV